MNKETELKPQFCTPIDRSVKFPPAECVMAVHHHGKEAFRINNDFEIIFSDDITPKEAGKIFAENFNLETSDRFAQLQAEVNRLREALFEIMTCNRIASGLENIARAALQHNEEKS